MSAGKLDKSNAFKPVEVRARQTSLSLSPEKVRINTHGIEFYSPKAIKPYTEMSVEIESPRGGKRLRCDGVVVACLGNKHTGYSVTMVFTSVTRAAEVKLDNYARLTDR